METPSAHWEGIYSTRSSSEVSWFQREPSVSLRLISEYSTQNSSVVDIGSGASLLADRLIALGYSDVTLLDISPTALDEVLVRVGDQAPLHFIAGDVLEWAPSRTYDLWHDRAVFHFLSPGRQRTSYIATSAKALNAGGALILGVFAEDGPSHCSGLVVQRYGIEELRELFEGPFSLVHQERESHVTPSGATQSFNWAVFSRNEN